MLPLPHLSSYYDLSTFLGRLEYNWALCSPFGLRWGEAAVGAAKETIAKSDSAEPADLQRAQLILAVCAPQGEIVPPPCRTCGWALATVPIIAFMVHNASVRPFSLPHIFIGQWLNQTQNAAITWCNRSSSSSSGKNDNDDSGNSGNASQSKFMYAYTAACATAIPIGVASALLAKRSALLRPLARFAAYPGVAAANIVNTCTMRLDDLTVGLPLLDAPSCGAQVGECSSPAAGWHAVRDTCATRVLIPLANFVAVPMIMSALAARAKASVRAPSLVMQAVVSGAVLVAAIPLACSVAPPVCEIAVTQVEPQIAEAAKASGRVGSVLWYERGF